MHYDEKYTSRFGARLLGGICAVLPHHRRQFYHNTRYVLLKSPIMAGELSFQFTIDYFTKKLVKMKGKPQCYVENNHEAIISPQVFDMVQAELERRKRVNGSHYSGVTIFSNKIKCGDCGGFFGSKVWH